MSTTSKCPSTHRRPFPGQRGRVAQRALTVLLALAVPSALVVLSPAPAQAKADRSVRVTLTSPPHALAEYQFPLLGTVRGVSPKGKRVVLQQRRGNRWSTIVTKRMGSRSYQFRRTHTLQQLGYKRYRVVAKDRSSVIGVSRVRRIHVHVLPPMPTPESLTAESLSFSSSTPSASRPKGLSYVPTFTAGLLRCVIGSVQVHAPHRVATSGYAWWVAQPFFLGTDGGWYPHPDGLMALQYNQTVNQAGQADTGWRALSTNEFSGFAERSTPEGTSWAVLNATYDVNLQPIGSGWSFVEGSPFQGQFCQT